MAEVGGGGVAWGVEEGGGTERRSSTMAQPRGFVCAEQRADKCRLLLTIYTLLHTPARATSKCTRRALSLLSCTLLLLRCPAIHRTSDTSAQDENAYSVSVSISVRGRDGKNPCEHITLTEIWPLSHPASARCVRIQRLTETNREREKKRRRKRKKG